MRPLVVDAGVLVGAADRSDIFSSASRLFLEEAAARAETIHLPASARLEMACALARRLRNKDVARKLMKALLHSVSSTEHVLDAPLLEGAIERGTSLFLRSGDAIYAALAQRIGGVLVTWDHELVQRAGAVTPEAWMQQK